MQQLLWNWLQLEKQRQPFKVLAKEQTQTVTVAVSIFICALTASINWPMAANSLSIIKLGSPSPSSWFGERLMNHNCRFMFYTTALSLRASLSHKIKASISTISRVTATVNQLPAVESGQKNAGKSLAELTEWQENLTQLGDNFCAAMRRCIPNDFRYTCNELSIGKLSVHELNRTG